MAYALRSKTEVISVRDFMAGNYGAQKRKAVISTEKQQKAALIAATMSTVTAMFTPQMASAGAVEGVIVQKTVHAFEPIIGLIQGLSYPVALIVMLSAGIIWMIGNQDRAMTMIQRAGFGYIIVQMAPMFMKLLVEVAKAF
ncbi:hypothetical protein GJU41_12110 [Bacillus idriensis]|uniref:TrbC/VirB2 family protein n=1 Tax=Metabacillus idriensis TaxID=324768 RepID=A0A6I2M9B5_9BACI|nr:TrbC/VirB2 family protein [Metabacillus idriensis]MRX54718.1 hypothetical protein [Metabacillus idriensis]